MRMLVAGLGYAGLAIAEAGMVAGFTLAGTARAPAKAQTSSGIRLETFTEAGAAIRAATHLVVTAAPEEAGCPVLLAHAEAIAQAPGLHWIGYLSTTGVYGDRGGAMVDEVTEPAPGQPRSQRRLAAEQAWRQVAVSAGASLDLFRIGGIYGPGRNALEDLRQGTARRVAKPGHAFSRIHRDDIARAVIAAAQKPAGRVRVLHLVDDEAAPQSAVVAEAARLLGVEPPPEVAFDLARQTMSPMALSFWSENRLVANVATKTELGISWRCPTYREGLACILAAEG